MNVTLVVFAPNGKSRTIPLKPGKYILGRHESATLRIPHPQVSRQHCEIAVEASGVTVRDLKSSNGTLINMVKASSAALEPGDMIGVGPFTIGVQINGVPATISPPAAPAPKPASDALAETPPAGNPAIKSAEPDDPERTVTKAPVPSIKGSLSSDDSSVFDFDFDFEDDNKAGKK